MVLTSVLTLFGLGLAAAAILAVASRVFYVEEDPRVEAVVEALPGANCGGCGYAGCEGYAQAVVNDSSVPASLCVAGGADVSIAVGELTGKTVSAAEPLVSFRRCDRIAGNVAQRYEYQGMPSCAAATLLSGGTNVCTWSCLGFGDCVQVCPFDAMQTVDGLVQVDSTKCTGCGMCVRACPRNSLELIPMRARVVIMCATKDKLRAVMDICDVGCINCGKCIKNCPAHAISTGHGRIHIDHQKCLSFGPECNEACVKGCSRHILRVACPTLAEDMRVAALKAASSQAAAPQAAADTTTQPHASA